MKIKRMISSKRDVSSEIISHMEKIISKKIINRKDKGKSMSIKRK